MKSSRSEIEIGGLSVTLGALAERADLQARVLSAVRHALIVDASPLAVRLLVRFMKDEALTPSFRRLCAKDVLSMVVAKPKLAREDAGAGSLQDMTVEALEAFVRRAERERVNRAERAKDVSAPVVAIDPRQVAEMLS